MSWWEWVLVAVVVLLLVVAVYDLVQRKHALLRNFPVVGHLRYLLEAIGPAAVHRHRQRLRQAVQP
jgi:hypothetical protein